MFGDSYRLFKLLGFEVKINPSWLIIAALIVWSLASGTFPHYFENLSASTYWWMGVAGAIGLFLSIILHELSHSLVARKFGMPIKGITLFIFGGVAEMNEEPPSAKSEFWMAIAGPSASIVLGLLFLGFNNLTNQELFPQAVHGVISYLAFINLLLAGFNLIPAFPLDGGRVLRSGLWAWKKNIRWATHISSKIGAAFGIFLIILGGISFFAGNFIGGIWWVLIGLFLRGASKMSYQQLLLRKALQGEVVKDFMNENPITVSPSLPIDQLIEDYIYKFHHKMYPVVQGDKLMGCVTTQDVKDIPKEERPTHTVGDVVKNCSNNNTISPDDDVIKVFMTMKRAGKSRLMVVENNHLVGVIALKDLLRFLSLKIDLDEEF